MSDLRFTELVAGEATEYVCKDCEQLRLSLVEDKSKCFNCGSTNIVVGKLGQLDKAKVLQGASDD